MCCGPESIAGRAAQIVNVAAWRGKIRDQCSGHPLDLSVERDGAIEHIVEDSGGLLAEMKVINALAALRKKLVFPAAFCLSLFIEHFLDTAFAPDMRLGHNLRIMSSCPAQA